MKTNKLNMEFKRIKIISLTNKVIHLYFISDDEIIKEDDWYYVSGGGDKKGVHRASINPVNYEWLHKIIATTDPKLINKQLIMGQNCPGLVDDGYTYDISQPSQSFIKKYHELNGIDEVDVEYLRGSDGYYDDDEIWHWKLLIPKVNVHNKINIHLI